MLKSWLFLHNIYYYILSLVITYYIMYLCTLNFKCGHWSSLAYLIRQTTGELGRCLEEENGIEKEIVE